MPVVSPTVRLVAVASVTTFRVDVSMRGTFNGGSLIYQCCYQVGFV